MAAYVNCRAAKISIKFATRKCVSCKYVAKMPSVIENQRMNKDRCLLLNKLIINNIYCIFFVFCFIRLLSDAELRKDLCQNVGVGDGAGDGAEMMGHLADLLAEQIGR